MPVEVAAQPLLPPPLLFGLMSMLKLWVASGLQPLAAVIAHVNKTLGAGANWWFKRRASLILRALRGEKGELNAEVDELLDVETPLRNHLEPFTPQHIDATQVYRLMGRHSEARRRFRDAARMIENLPEWYSVTVMWAARHHRNALEYGNPAQKRTAREFFQSHVDRGYFCFLGLVE